MALIPDSQQAIMLPSADIIVNPIGHPSMSCTALRTYHNDAHQRRLLLLRRACSMCFFFCLASLNGATAADFKTRMQIALQTSIYHQCPAFSAATSRR